MAVLHQEVDAMLLGRDGVGIRLRNPLHHLHGADVEFVPPGRALVGADLAFDDDTRFLGQTLDRVEHLRGNGVLRDHTLDEPAAVPEDRKQQFPALAQVVQPAADGDTMAVVFSDFGDGR